MTTDRVKVHGTLFRAFLSAGESMRLLLQGNIEHLESYVPNAWYGFDEFKELLRLTRRHSNSGIIFQQLGSEMMKTWYHHGPGKAAISSSLDFLKFQGSSRGFLSVISGPPEIIGCFALKEFDEAAGRAVVRSTTIFPRELERGILLGGLGLVGDLLYFNVDNSRDKSSFEISFVNRNNRQTVTWQPGRILDEAEWKYRHQANIIHEKEQLWSCITDTLNAAYQELLKLATIDPLTQLYIRREFRKLADIELRKSRRKKTPVSLLYLDIDHFKRINDSFGHDAGDKALEAFASLCKNECRQYDLVSRYGGDEFCILLPFTGVYSAAALAERILGATRNTVVELTDAELSLTVSIGVVAYDGIRDLDALLDRADTELRRAKKAGRDRLSVAG